MSVTCRLIIYAGLSTAGGARTNQIAECQRMLKKVGGAYRPIGYFHEQPSVMDSGLSEPMSISTRDKPPDVYIITIATEV